MSIKLVSAAIVALPLLATSALADGHTSSSPTWDGVYFGLLAGLEDGDSKSNAVGSTTTLTTDFDGAKIGALVGVNASNGNFVYGVEADISVGDVEGSSTCSTLPQTCAVESEWEATLRARAGVVHNDILFYGTAGAAFAEAKSTTSPATGGTTGTYTSSLTGWAAGLGAEIATSNDFRFRVEYLRTEYGKETAPAGTVGTTAFEGDRTSNQVRFAVIKSF